MTTIAQLVNTLDRELLHHYSRPVYDNPGATFTTTATTVQLATAPSVSPGAILDIGFELMYVTSWATNTATVIRGFLGTTARAGATTDLVRINPRVSSVAMLDAITDELRSWDEQLFAVEKEAITFGAYIPDALASPTRAPYRVVSARPQVSSVYQPRKWINLDLRRAEATGQYATGYSVHLPPGLVFEASTVVDVVYAVPFDLSSLASTVDLESTIGLSVGMLEILKWGVLARVLSGRVEGRADPFGNVRPDIEQTIPSQGMIQSAAWYRSQRDRAYHNEAQRLLGIYPYRTGA